MLPLGVMSLTAVSAQATQVEWFNGLLQPHQDTGTEPQTNHMLSSTVYYTGSGTVSVCEKVFDYTIAAYVSSKCGNNFAEATPGELEPHLGQTMGGSALNNSSFAHTIHLVYVF
jgi:hypothetical protein